MRACMGITLLLCLIPMTPCLAQKTVTFDAGKKSPIVNVPIDTSTMKLPAPTPFQPPRKPFSISDYLPKWSWPFSKPAVKKAIMPLPTTMPAQNNAGNSRFSSVPRKHEP